MSTFYPAGDEQTMVQWVTGRSVPERGLPLDVEAVVDNVGTMLTIYDAITEGSGVSMKYLSVVGEVPHPVMIHAPIGTPITQCIAAAKPLLKEYAVIVGGPMMGKVLADPQQIQQAVVTKTPAICWCCPGPLPDYPGWTAPWSGWHCKPKQPASSAGCVPICAPASRSVTMCSPIW